ncbi:UDP-galactose transporter like [Actinidia chinensis var. chinensis]|uniref:UDP-galactose transporter like n=1 Tax=Actinidia chinensis var. chinensis TaxID=1590841 RepID=A0A2R6R2T8_ACTCC|nr:UDP-galactose transporter like [Actinidia chinensis var. chinensis]
MHYCIAHLHVIIILCAFIEGLVSPIHGLSRYGDTQFSLSQDMVILNSIHILFFAGVYSPFMHHCSRDQPQPVHMHWKIHSRVLPSSRSYEDNTRLNPGFYILWEGGSKSTSGPRHGHSCDRNGLVRQCIV